MSRIILWGFYSTLIALFLANPVAGQQIFPVKVSGNLVQPNSLVLSDYTFARASDISFMVTLTDPVEPNRLVQFRITVLNEGNPVLVTNPNYSPPPIVLESQIPQFFDGADLAGYLNPANLQSVNGNGQPGDLLPRGYNSICVEVIDVQRNVAISDRICANGFFELAPPPLLNYPACGALIPYQPNPNITFNWTPMHQLSANRPTNVTYEFTLVKLFPGVVDPNDGFNLSTVILKTTVNQPVLQYLEDNPPLEQDALYAWRVQALDGRGYDLFINHGYSQICSFAFENGGQLGSALFACSGGDCSFAQPISATPLTNSLTINDEVSVGFFKLKLTAVSPNSQGGYAGTGTIYVPYLFSKIKVSFSDLQVNRDLRMFAGDLYADVQNPTLIPPLFSAANGATIASAAADMATGFADGTAQALTDYFNTGGAAGPPNMVSLLKTAAEENAIPIGLPIGIDEMVPGTTVRTTVAITGVHFTARQANLNAVLAVQMGNNGIWVKFGAKGLCFQPRGLSLSAPTLMLLNDVNLTDAGIPLTIQGMAADGSPSTFLSWDCEGFDRFELKGKYDFSRDYIRPVANPAGQVSGVFTFSTRRLDDILIKVDAPEDFYITGASDFPFHVGDLWLDYSKTRNPKDLAFPDNYPDSSANLTFRGAYITEAGVTLPAIFQNSTTTTLPKLIGQNLLFDQNGMTGSVGGQNLINLASGDLGGWGYSLDSSWLNITANKFVNSGFKGKMRLPIMREDESLKYTGAFVPGVDSTGTPTGFIDFGFKATPDIVTIDLLKAKIEFDPSSEITVGRLNGQFQSPKADLSGLLTAAATQGDPGFAGKIMEQIEALQKAATDLGLGALVPQLNIDGIRFDNMKIDLMAADKFQIRSIVPQNAGFQFLGINADLSSLNFATLSAADLTKLNMASLPNVIPRSMNFKMDIAKDILGALAPSVAFTLVVKEETTTANKTKYSFGGFDLQFTAPDIAIGCNLNIPPIPLDASPANFATAPIQGNLKAGHFILKPKYPLTSDNGTGLISGTGTVDVDILGPFKTLGVTFNNVQVDQSGRIVTGEVITGGDANLFNAPNLSGVMSNVQSQVNSMVAGMNQFNLPVVMGKKANGENERDQGLILMGLVFGPSKATARAKVIFDPAGNGNFIEFVAEGLELMPNGVANFDVAVGLARDYEFQPINSLNPLVFKAYNAASNTGSFIKMDCKGFLEFNMQASYTFSEDMLVSLDHPDEPVTGTFSINTIKWGEFMADIDGLGRFTFPGMDGFEMNVSAAYIDFSRERNVATIEFPENYNNGGVPSQPFRWRGFYMPNLSIKLPPEFSLSSKGAPTLTCRNMLIDDQGMSFSLFGNNLIDGNVEGWGFALDSVGITVVSNSLTNGALAGSIVMPLMDAPMNYIGNLEKDGAGFWGLKLRPIQKTHFALTAINSYIDIEPSSEIVLTTVPHPTIEGKRVFKPYASLYGKLGVDVKKSDFQAAGDNIIMDAIAVVENVLDAEFSFVPPAISLYGLKINHPDLPPGKKFGLDAYEIEGNITLGGKELKLDQMDFLDEIVNIKGVNYEGLGIQFNIDVSPLTCKLGIWAKKNPTTGKYGFGKFVFEVNAPKMSCVADPNNPAKFTVGSGIDVIQIPFLACKFAVMPVPSSPNFRTAPNNSAGPIKFPFSLIEKLKQIGSELPFGLAIPSVQSTGASPDTPFDFIISGITFKPDGLATMNAELKVRIDGKDVSFVSSLPIDKRGIYFNDIRVGLGKDLRP
jgi:hypothetical protein